MATRLPRIVKAKQLLKRSLSANSNGADSIDVPKGYIAVYVSQSEKKRYVIRIAFLNLPPFQELLIQAVEEFGFDHPMRGLTFLRPDHIFIGLTSSLSGNSY